MQFFPVAQSHGVQFSRPSGLFELAEAKPGQDFNDLFSAHLDDPQMPDEPPRAEQPLPQSTQARAFADDSQPDRNHGEAASPVSHSADNQGASSRADVAGRKDERPREGSAEPAKDAGQRQDAARSEQSKSSHKVASKEERPASDGMNAAADVELSDEALVAEVREFLDILAADASKRKGGPDAAVLSPRIEALHELLRQFKDAPPASRSELAVTLGEQLRALHAELTAGSRAEGFGDSRGKSGRASRVISPVEQRAHALLHKLEARTTAGREVASEQARSVPSGSSVAFGPAALKDDQGGRPRQVGGSAAAIGVVAAKVVDNSARKHGEGADTEASGVRKEGRGQAVAARAASREQQAADASQSRLEFRGAGLEASSEKSPQAAAGLDNSALPADHVRKSVATDVDQAQARAKGQEGSTRNEAATHAGIAAAANRPAVVRDAPAQTLQQTDHLRQDGPVGASEKARAADSKGAKSQPDARQGFFGEPERERTASRAAQAVGNGKNVPESMTQTSAQSVQTQFQQRLESPVSARSAHVYQQVENGAFKNLGQGVKQLVIRLDPADLGQVSVILQVRGKEVQAVLRSSNQETSLALNEQLGQLRSQLEAQGLKVGKLEVQTQLADSQSQSQWQGAESHNRYQENQELAMSAKRWRTLERAAPGLVRDVQNSPHRENLSQSGLDIFA
jgi:flagellar hook-length control protein FliK